MDSHKVLSDHCHIEYDKAGELTNITELDREEYEQFLEIMEKLRIAYNVLINR